MKYRNLTLKLISLALLMSFFSCSKHPSYKKTSDGLYYKIIETKKDTTTIKDDMVLFLSLKYQVGDSVLFNSTQLTSDFSLPMQAQTYRGDIYDAFKLLHPGDTASFILSADSFFLKTLKMPVLPDSTMKGKEITFFTRIHSATTREQIEQKHKAEMAEFKDSEDALFAAYLKENNITIAPLSSGLYYIVEKKGNNQKPKNGDIVDLHIIVKNLKDDVLFSSYEQGRTMQMEYGKTFDNDGATEAVNLMSKGEKAKAILPSSLAFGERGIPGMIDPYSPLVYQIEMVNFMSKEKFEEMKKQEADKLKNEETSKLNAYIKSKNITVKPLASGMYIIVEKKGNGQKPKAGQTVKVHYTGTLLDGTKFDSSRDRNKEFEFTLGQGQVIKGWDEGIALMSKGEKATFIIPSYLAYGENGSQPIIKPFSTLIFDVELIDYK